MTDSEEVKRKLRASATIRSWIGPKPNNARAADVIKDVKAMIEFCEKNFPTEFDQVFGDKKIG